MESWETDLEELDDERHADLAGDCRDIAECQCQVATDYSARPRINYRIVHLNQN